MSMRNSDPEDGVHFRSDRVISENGRFFFLTREGSLEGPYASRQQADVAIALFIRHHLDPSLCESRRQLPTPPISRLKRHCLEFFPPERALIE